ncbi:MAG: ATP-dependent helicase [Kiritimatiellae bacterium]|nr:ATP-dependent helicase [Kiritimatiellia bacterium]
MPPVSGIDFQKELNEEQRAAVLAPDGPVLVIAAAGTGKTRTLTYRVAHLVERGVDTNRILLLTFTNRAAHEMLERAQGLVGEAVGGLWGGTFHHMANRILRRHAPVLGYGADYTILDQDDARSLLRACADELDLLGKHFPKPDVLLSVFGLAASTEREIRDVAGEHFEHHEIDLEDVLRVYDAYQGRKVKLNAMDFDDLLANARRLFAEHEEVLDRYRERFLHVLVDEYQDTNTVQAALVDALASCHRNLLVVGDDFQSIYSWRGANFRNILSFPKRYADARVFKLVTNYRSVPEILDVANACIAGNPEQFQKVLRAVRESYHRPVLAAVRDGGEQARFVIERIARLRREGYSARQIVVLYRSHFHAMELQMELTRQRMPYIITSGVRFFEQAHIKDVCAVPRLLKNPADELSFLRLLGLLHRVGKRTAAKLWDGLGRRFNALDDGDRKKMRERLPAAARAEWKTIETVLDDYQHETLEQNPAEVIQRFVNQFYDEYAVETFDNYARRVEDLQELAVYATQFKTVDAFLSEMALLTNLDAEADDPHAEHDETIRLSTIHQAKGLEWSVVFVLWLTDGMFPSGRSLNDDGGEAEERRLFYVATTRAKDELYLCVPEVRRSRDGDVDYCTPSRFVEEIPADLMQRESVGFI